MRSKFKENPCGRISDCAKPSSARLFLVTVLSLPSPSAGGETTTSHAALQVWDGIDVHKHSHVSVLFSTFLTSCHLFICFQIPI